MPDINQQISEFLARRQTVVAQTLEKGGEQADALLKSYGAPSSFDAMVAGGEQGVMHGFADDIERSQSPDRVAKNQIMAKAAHPLEYEISALLGTMLAAGGLRGAQALIGRAASAGSRVSASASVGAGGAAIAARQGEKAKRISNAIATFGMKPNHRGMVMDAGHGALWGYGGSDVSKDEEAFAPERFARAGMGAGASAVLAPLAASAGVAAGNIPLAFGGRRAFSKPMLEPPGVVTKGQAFWNKVLNRNGPRKADPVGRPRDAIEIARSRDETAARGDVDIFTGQSRNPGIIARDTAPPMQSTGRNTQQLADQAIAPVAPERIAALKGQERNMAADAMEGAYPDTRAPAQHDPQWFHSGTIGPDDAVDVTRGELGFHVGSKQSAEIRSRDWPSQKQTIGEYDVKGNFARVPDLGQWGPDDYLYARRRSSAFDENHEPMWRELDAIAQRNPSRQEWTAAAQDAARRHGVSGWEYKNVQEGGGASRIVMDPQGIGRSVVNPAAPDPQTDKFVNDMMEAFTRQDRPALESWVSTLEAAARKNPAIMPQIKASVARQLAINERSNPDLNNTPVMKNFLTALGLWGNKAKGVPNILEAARAPAREAFPTGRYEDAITRTQGETPMRPRHADAMRTEMDNFEPGPYTGPADARRGPPTIARGDDTPHWLNPVDFFKDGKVNNAEVTAAGLLSGPIAYEAENRIIGPAMNFMVGAPDNIRTPQQPQPAGILADIPPDAAPMPEEDEPLIPASVMPQRAAVPVASPPQAAQQRPEKAIIMDIQRAMLEAGINVGGRDGQPDGVAGPLTRRAIDVFTMGTTRSLEDVLNRIRNYPRGQLARILQGN